MTRIPIALVGLNFGRHQVDTMLTGRASKFVRLTTLCDRMSSRLDPLVQRTGLKGTRELDDVLADPTIKAVGLFTGPVGRAELIRKIIRTGRDVITTKPFERDSEAAAEILREAKDLGRVIHLNSPGPEMTGELRQVKIWQQEYKLGRVIACRRSTYASYREAADGSWYDDPTQCPVAPIFRLGIYSINDLVRLLGPAEKVSVLQSRLLTGRTTPDNAQLGILFKSGAIANIFASFCINDGLFYRNEFTLNFEGGSIFCNIGPETPGGAKAAMTLVTGNRPKTDRAATATANFDDVSGDYQWEAFAKAVEGKPLRDEVTAEEIVAGIRIIEAMSRAEQTGCVEQVSEGCCVAARV